MENVHSLLQKEFLENTPTCQSMCVDMVGHSPYVSSQTGCRFCLVLWHAGNICPVISSLTTAARHCSWFVGSLCLLCQQDASYSLSVPPWDPSDIKQDIFTFSFLQFVTWDKRGATKLKQTKQYTLIILWASQIKGDCLPNDVSQDPQLDEPTHHSHPPVPHQHLAGGLVLKEEVREGVTDLALHLLSPVDPQRPGSVLSP